MNGLREKFRNKKGFTLVEMLIVVAIIAILVAVSIPVIGSALEGARDATDRANERAAKAEAVIVYMGVDTGKYGSNTTGTYWYDANNGKLVLGPDKPTGNAAITAYGQCTKAHTDGTFSKVDGPHTDKIIKAVIADDGTVTMTWE